MRSKQKGPFFDHIIVKDLDKSIKNGKELVIDSRRSIIIPQFLDKTALIHNGKQYIKQKVTLDMLGHKFGEFSFTRKIYKYKKKKKGKK